MPKRNKQFKQKLLKFIWGSLPTLVVIILVILAVIFGSKAKQEKNRIESEKAKALKTEQPAPNVIALNIQTTTIEDALNLPGVISPWEDLLVRTEVSGQIIDTPVKEGDLVVKGQVLARLDRRDYENRRAQEEAAYHLAKLGYDRFSKLSKMKAISEAELDSSLARLKETKANLASAKLDLERTVIIAPMSGYINHLDAKVGLLVNRPDPIAQILDTNKIKVEIGIPESDIDAIQNLEKAQITVEALGGKTFIGKKIFLSRQPDSSSRVYNLKLAVNNTEGQLLPGMFCRVELVKHRYEDAVSIPLYAVIARREERFVYIANDSKAHYRRVELGVLDGWQVQITDGLKVGDRVIIVGHRSLEDGQKINIQRTVQDPAELKESRGPQN